MISSRLVGLRALLAASAFGLAAPAMAQSTGTILWDNYAVPHIYGPDIPTVIKGLGYAAMENHAETVLSNVALARGRYAEYFGAGPNNSYVAGDELVRIEGIPNRAVRWLQQGGATQQQYIQAVCDGANEYAQRYGSTIPPQLQKILPLVPTDVTALEQYTIWFNFLTETSNVPNLEANWLATGSLGTPPQNPAIPRNGSNGWAIGPAKLVPGNGNAILMGNPHLPWGVNAPPGGLGIYQWMEANLVVGNPNSPTLNAQGVTFVGAPFIGIGFNDYLGWTHTNNTIKNADLYQLTLDSTGNNYLYAGQYYPLVHSTDTIQVLQADGTTLLPQTVDIYNAIQGPVIAFNSGRTKALALRVPGLAQNSLVTQYWDMITATSLKQFMAAESQLQMPFFNTMYADKSGKIFYLFGGGQPDRSASNMPFLNYEMILDGTNPALVWTQTLPFSKLPQAINPTDGFIANSNNPPWNTAFNNLKTFATPPGLTYANFPQWIAPQFMEMRPQHGTNLLAMPHQFTYADILGFKMSVESELADRIVGDLITLGQGGDANQQAAAAILMAWDHTMNANSVGGVLFENWWNRVIADINANPQTVVPDTTDSLYYQHPKFKVGWSASAPISTPSGLDAVNNAILLTELENAYNFLQTNFASAGGAKAPWGALHKTTLVTRSGVHTPWTTPQVLMGDEDNIFSLLPPTPTPNSGTDDVFGPLRVADSANIGPFFISYGGDGYVQLVEFTSAGTTGGTLLTYGNSSRYNSPHITDQQPLYNSFSLKPLLRNYSAVQQAAVKQESY